MPAPLKGFIEVHVPRLGRLCLVNAAHIMYATTDENGNGRFRIHDGSAYQGKLEGPGWFDTDLTYTQLKALIQAAQ